MATVGLSLDIFCRGLLRELSSGGYEVVALSSPDSHLRSLAAREGVRALGIPMRRDISPLADLKALCRLVILLRRERPDMIHTMTPKAGLLGMMAAAIAQVPVRVHTFTGLLFPTATGSRKWLLRLTDRITCLCATHIIPEGQGVKADLLDGGITHKPMHVLGHGNVRGIDLDHYRLTPDIMAMADTLRQRLGIGPADRVLVFIGRMVGDKGLRELLQAFRSLGRRDTHLVLVGDKEGGHDDLSPSELTGIPGLHTSGGWVDDVRPWLAMADALVFPSYREGFPNVVLEAGAMERPSVVTDINGSREIITDGMNGFIVPPRAVTPLRDALSRLLSLPLSRLRGMGRAARADVEARFSQTYVRACLKAFYSSILTPHTPDGECSSR